MAAEESGETVTGTVSWFSVIKGYGFITRTDGGGDVFVHQSDLHSEGFRSLREGEEVHFRMGLTADGKPKATNVTGPDGAFVLGAPRRSSGGGGPRGEGRAAAGRGGRGEGAGRGAGRARGARPPREEPEGTSSGLQVVVLNLPWTATWQALKDLMAPAGAIESAEIAADAGGRSRGYGTVRYTSKEGADAAVATLNGVEFEGRALTVKLDRYG